MFFFLLLRQPMKEVIDQCEFYHKICTNYSKPNVSSEFTSLECGSSPNPLLSAVMSADDFIFEELTKALNRVEYGV